MITLTRFPENLVEHFCSSTCAMANSQLPMARPLDPRLPLRERLLQVREADSTSLGTLMRELQAIAVPDDAEALDVYTRCADMVGDALLLRELEEG
jgi:hypothetical protein